VLRAIQAGLARHAGKVSPLHAWGLELARAGNRDAIADVLEAGVRISAPRGRPPGSLPDWQATIAALDALLRLDGMPTELRNKWMSDARSELFPAHRFAKAMHRSNASAIRKAFEPMRRRLDRKTLRRLAGPAALAWLALRTVT
jgi:hypothetical protein